jgi:hypothetical protein
MKVNGLDKRWFRQIGFMINEHFRGISFPFGGYFGNVNSKNI